jgi:hypothetical protein
MTSKNLGEQENKPDYAVLFEDFPNCFNGDLIELATSNDYHRLLEECVFHVGWAEILKARRYGLVKYSRYNWRESRGADDHQRFMDANQRSIYRHLAERDDTCDEDSGCKHLAHVALRCMIAIEYDKAEPQPSLPVDDQMPTYRESLKRGNEMAGWLIELITERHDVGDLFPDSNVDALFHFDATPEGLEFWQRVNLWQQGIGRHPEQPKK